MADTIDVVGIVVQRPVRIMLEVIIVSGFGSFFRRRCVVRHRVLSNAPNTTIPGEQNRLVREPGAAALRRIDREADIPPGFLRNSYRAGGQNSGSACPLAPSAGKPDFDARASTIMATRDISARPRRHGGYIRKPDL